MAPNKDTPRDVKRVLHCHSTFDAGGKEVRAVRLMNAFGGELEHTIVSGVPDAVGARALIAAGIKAHFPQDFPALSGLPTPGRLVEIAKAMKPYDLVLTYNWGAMDAVMAHTIFARPLGLPPLIHHEDGFNEDEVERLKPGRNFYRRAALTRTPTLVVPSRVLEAIAQQHWHVPRARIQRIPNGIDTTAFAGPARPETLRVVKRAGECWVGTLAGLRAVKQLDMLVRAAARLPENWHLVILGEGPERDAIRAVADALEVSHRVHMPGAYPDPARVIGLFDIFALSSKSEQFPLSVVEAMAAGLPIAAPDVGDIAAMVAEPNRPYIAVRDDEEALALMLADLADDADLRAQLGAANREKARAHFDESRMVAAYRALYWGAMEAEAPA